jgi:hypothetical protein
METSKNEMSSMFATVVIIITVAFLAVQVVIWTGALQTSALGNLGYGLDKILENPAFVGLLGTLIIGAASGFMQKVFKTNETFDVKKFGETFYYYEPLMILVGQFIPVSYGIVLLFVIDIFRRVLLKLVPKPP